MRPGTTFDHELESHRNMSKPTKKGFKNIKFLKVRWSFANNQTSRDHKTYRDRKTSDEQMHAALLLHCYGDFGRPGLKRKSENRMETWGDVQGERTFLRSCPRN
jgi:hypothetical protein